MWWMENRFSRITHHGICSSEQHRRPGHASVYQQTAGEIDRSCFRSLGLTAAEHDANLLLSEAHHDLLEQNERLLADIKALEAAFRETHRRSKQDQAEITRLRSECDRWLAETFLLTERLNSKLYQVDQKNPGELALYSNRQQRVEDPSVQSDGTDKFDEGGSRQTDAAGRLAADSNAEIHSNGENLAQNRRAS